VGGGGLTTHHEGQHIMECYTRPQTDSLEQRTQDNGHEIWNMAY